uniref:RNA-directed DNA polymerase, eukaryota, reverse transcriptase zinc-binding domain protein n=1 Tax=Tanacetum cinerariifolium TaxID=118510 RepID=A0A699GSB4_TANCI|nr:RNA-directed DNA polymerase, eukaryota, reverse transcriptase zinc-binding domain protein [Tanacetum cinerariifolium]
MRKKERAKKALVQPLGLELNLAITTLKTGKIGLQMEKEKRLVKEKTLKQQTESYGSIAHHPKLQDLKKIIRVWIKESNASQVGAKKVILDNLVIIDKNLDKGMVSDELLAKRMDLSRKLHDLKQMKLKDAAQKAKVNWAIEGDENSKFFFMESLTRDPSCGRLKLNMSFPNRLSSDQVGDLDKDISIDEIRKAVWDCGESKSSGPDGFTFEFFKRYWHFIGPDFCTAVNCFFDKGRFSRGSNSPFITLIPKVMDAKFVTDFRPISLIGSVYKVVTKILANRLTTVISGLISNTQSAFVANRHILDGPFILNEVLAWCKMRRKQALVFKVDFAKAYDTVCSSMASILINGSPSYEFPIFSGLKQDDAVFIGEWSIENFDNLLKFLNCFHLASGLCINVNKSHVLGVGVPLDIVRQGALRIGCEVMQTPFKYLGVMDSKITWVAWAKVLSSKKNRGLGVSSFFALNRALLLKWVWRYLVQDGSLWYHIISAIYDSRLKCHFRNTLSPWGVILREVHQLASKSFNFHSHCKIRVGDGLNTRFWFDTWILDLPLNVWFPRLFAPELDKDISVAAKWSAPSFDASFRRQVGDGVERNQWSALFHMLGTITLSSSSDRYFCDLNSDGAYRVKDIRSELDDLFLPSSAVATRWVNLVPIKVNIFA